MKKHSTLERLDLGREIRILALGLIGSLIMAINIKPEDFIRAVLTE